MSDRGPYPLLRSLAGVCLVAGQAYLLPLILPLDSLVSLARSPLWICSGILPVASFADLDYMEFRVKRHPAYIPTPSVDLFVGKFLFPLSTTAFT
jgi:hypothetical protein